MVTAVVLVGLAIFAFFLFYPPYVASETKKLEKEHMEGVRETFLDIQQMVSLMGEGESKSIEIPMYPRSSFLIPPSGSAAGISITASAGEKFGALAYRLSNTYYPNQTYVLEGGGVILEQGGVEVMTFDPNLVSGLYLGDNYARVDVEEWYVVGENVWMSKTGSTALTISCVDDDYEVYTGDSPNAENVVVDLTGKVEHENAWTEYLTRVRDELNAQGLNASLDGLKLTILGRVTGAGTKDIYYYKHVKKIEISVR